jgi:hypothetical protein
VIDVRISSTRDDSVARDDRDRGSTSLTIVLLAPIVTALMFVGLQAALWNHARTEARVVARSIAALVARDRMPAAEATAAARESLAGSELHEAQVQVSSDGGNVTVSITGDAPGILRGTSQTVRVSVRLPIEGWVPL